MHNVHMSAVLHLVNAPKPISTPRRPSRMPVDCAVLISRADESWASAMQDISATGVLIKRPIDWIGRRGEIFILDMLFNDDLDIHVEARVARVTDTEIGFVFARIPPDKELPLWNLLGGYADSIEFYLDL
jgi:hypothetical protein